MENITKEKKMKQKKYLVPIKDKNLIRGNSKRLKLKNAVGFDKNIDQNIETALVLLASSSKLQKYEV